MSVDLKKHTSIAAGEKPTRAALAAAILSINDIVPVANATEANQVAVALQGAGVNLANTPLFVARADAPGLRRVEYSYDGTVWLPACGVLTFASTGARDTWTTSNSAMLAFSDKCSVGSAEYKWNGSTWVLYDTGWVSLGVFNSNWSVAAGVNPFYRVLDQVLFFNGRVSVTSTAGDTIFTTALPATARPSKSHDDMVHNTSAAGSNANVSTAGVITISHGTSAINDILLGTFKPIPLG